MRIGIPRALLIYHYWPMWKTFLEELGQEVILSTYTTKKTLDEGIKLTVDDACLPVKIFHGHISGLMNDVDFILIPRMMSVAPKEFICPKFCGLPEMVRFGMNLTVPMQVLDINLHKNRKSLYKSYYDLGKVLGKSDGGIRKAFLLASRVQDEFEDLLLKGQLPNHMIDGRSQDDFPFEKTKKIGVLGHPYILYDDFLTGNLLKMMNDYHMKLITPEMVEPSTIEQQAGKLSKKMFWTLGKTMYGSARHMVESEKVDGILYLSSFGCGIDSLIADLVERYVRKNSETPYTFITLDEHTGDAGIKTRIEAFIDMINWRSRNENHFSSHG